MNAWGSRKYDFWHSILSLFGHLLGTAAIFIAFFSISWALAWILHVLDSIYPFAPETLNFVRKLETGVIYADSLFCGCVLLAGTWRFLKDILL